jgi:hypothetical protein
MTGLATAAARIIAALAVLALTTACAARTLARPAPGQRAARIRPALCSSPASARPRAPAARAGLTALLPDSPAWIEGAAGLAARFAAAYTTWSYAQPPAAWLARLRPITTSQLYSALAQAAWTPGILAQRHHAHLAAAGTVSSEQIRDLAPGMVIITVQVRQVITSPAGRSEAPDDLAVTVAQTDRGGQAVWDVEPAAAGNTGGDPDGSPAP